MATFFIKGLGYKPASWVDRLGVVPWWKSKGQVKRERRQLREQRLGSVGRRLAEMQAFTEEHSRPAHDALVQRRRAHREELKALRR